MTDSDLQALSDAATPDWAAKRAELEVRWSGKGLHPMTDFEMYGAVQRDAKAPIDFGERLGDDPVRDAPALAEYDRRALLNLVAELLDRLDLRAATPVVPDGLRETAQAVLDDAEPDENFEGEYIDWLVPHERIEALRTALAASPSPALISAPAAEPYQSPASPSPDTDPWKDGYRAGYVDGERGSDPAVANVDAPSPDTDAGLDEAWAEWIVREHPVRPDVPKDRVSPAVYDWACAECTVGKVDPPTIPGFRCVPHQAAARLATSDKGQPDDDHFDDGPEFGSFVGNAT